MPITENVYHVLHRGRPLPEAVRVLLERGHKDELHGIDSAGAAVGGTPDYGTAGFPGSGQK